jgi:NADH-quinone oxidoreductase subunit G
MCDEGRFGYKYIHADQRLKTPVWRRTNASTNGNVQPAPTWSEVLNHVRQSFQKVAQTEPQAIVAVFSPWMTCEEAFLLATWMKNLSQQARLVLGPVPIAGEDDLYPKDWRGHPILPPKFIIRAEKCPNRRGVQAVLEHFQSPAVEFSEVLHDAGDGRLRAAYVVGGGPPAWLETEQVALLAKVPLLVVQDILRSELTDAAQIVLPGASFAEKEGTYVNHAGLAQMIMRSIHCPAEGYSDGRIFMEILNRPGLFNARILRQQLAGEVPVFAPLQAGDLGETGVMLDLPGTQKDSVHVGGAQR